MDKKWIQRQQTSTSSGAYNDWRAVMRVLVVGASGLLGLAISRELVAQGHDVLGFGRSKQAAQKLAPELDWVFHDLADLTSPHDWASILEDVEGVVNAAGALQTGSKDKLAVVHDTATSALVQACEQANVRTFVQISAPDARGGKNKYKFYQTKAAGDRHVQSSTLDWFVIRPGLVVGRAAYGGTQLLRSLAVFPWVQPSLFSDRQVQTVALSDVAKTVADVVNGRIPSRSDFDLVEDTPHSVDDILSAYRSWLGLPKAKFNIHIPPWLAMIGAKGADVLGWLGWRLPFRSTSLKVMQKDVLGNPKPFQKMNVRKLLSFPQTLASMPSSNTERWHARISLFLPLLLTTLSLFWLASGVIGLLNLSPAIAVLSDTNINGNIARILVIGGSLVDIALGMLVWVRKWAAAMCLAMVGVTLIYLVSASILTPYLWSDPMGPLVKSLPAMVLALFTSFFLEDR